MARDRVKTPRAACLVLVLAWLVGMCSADGGATDAISALNAAGLTRYIQVIDAAGATKALSKHSSGMGGALVIIAPTNAAVDTWLKASGLTMDDLKARKALAQRVVGYTLVLPSHAMGDLSKLKPGSKEEATGNLAWNITMMMGKDGRLSVKDSHDTVIPISGPVDSSPHFDIYTADKMPLPGDVFIALHKMDFMMGSAMRDPFSLFQAAVDRAGYMADLKSLGGTVFAPTDDAFKATGLTKDAIAKADPATLRSLVQYHSVSGYKAIPGGFTSGKAVPTMLKGSGITVTLASEMMKGGYRMGQATVTDTAGNKAKVVAPNYFSGKTTIHGIDRVLAYAKPGSMAPAGGRKLLSEGRKLLQSSRDPDTASLLSQSNSRDAILAAVNSDAPNSAYRATQIAQLNAAYTAYPTTRQFLYIGGSGGLNR